MRGHRTWSLDSILANPKHALRGDVQTLVDSLRDEPVELMSREADYEVAWILGNGFRVIVYPHKTSAGHIHLRTRHQGKNVEGAKRIMAKLYAASGHNCTFQWKGMSYNDRTLRSAMGTES